MCKSYNKAQVVQYYGTRQTKTKTKKVHGFLYLTLDFCSYVRNMVDPLFLYNNNIVRKPQQYSQKIYRGTVQYKAIITGSAGL